MLKMEEAAEYKPGVVARPVDVESAGLGCQ